MPARTSKRFAEYAQRLNDARKTRRAMSRLTISDPDITIPDAYEIQKLVIGNSRHAGIKVGLTSVSAQLEAGVAAPVHGVLLAKEAVDNGGEISPKKLIHPRAEPNLVFVLPKALPKNATNRQIRDGISEVRLGLEILDSRYIFAMYAIQDLVADNCSAAHHVIGDRVDVALDDLANMDVWIGRHGLPVHHGNGAAILGDPLRSLEILVKIMGGVPAGPVFAGAATPSIPVHPFDDIEVTCPTGARAAIRVR